LEICQGCSTAISRNDERIVSAGKQWHKHCFEATQGPKALGDNRIAEKNAEICPGCGQYILVSEERIVSQGRQWHKPCHEATQGSKALPNNRIDEKKYGNLS